MKRMGVALATALMIGTTATGAQAAPVVNGGFETGDLSGWTTNVTGASASGDWFAYSASNLLPPLSAVLNSPVASPPEGTHASLTDMINPGRRTLYQDVALDPAEPGLGLTLSLYVYYRAPQSNAFKSPSPDSVDPSAPGGNQQFRVEVMKPSAPITSVDPADILATVFRTNTGDPLTLTPMQVSADLTPFAGQTVRLRFTEVDSNGIVNASTDDVRIVTTKPPAPTIQFSAPTRDRKQGTATLPATVNGAGSVVISGDGIATTTVEATAAGTIQLPVTPVSPLKGKVKKDRKGQANISATFTDVYGKTVTDVRRVHLRHKRR